MDGLLRAVSLCWGTGWVVLYMGVGITHMFMRWNSIYVCQRNEREYNIKT